MAPLHDAIRAGNVEALRRELERGVSPDIRILRPVELFTRYCCAPAPSFQQTYLTGHAAKTLTSAVLRTQAASRSMSRPTSQR